MNSPGFLALAVLLVPVRALALGVDAAENAVTAAKAVSASQRPLQTFESLRLRYAGAVKPATADLRTGKEWTCYGAINRRDDKPLVVDAVIFYSFEGRVAGRGSVPQGSLEYRENDGSLFSSFAAGRKGEFSLVPTYRKTSDGNLIREVDILWTNLLPLDYPDGFAPLDPIGFPKKDYALARSGRRTAGWVYSYSLCKPSGT